MRNAELEKRDFSSDRNNLTIDATYQKDKARISAKSYSEHFRISTYICLLCTYIRPDHLLPMINSIELIMAIFIKRKKLKLSQTATSAKQ